MLVNGQIQNHEIKDKESLAISLIVGHDRDKGNIVGQLYIVTEHIGGLARRLLVNGGQ